MELKKRNLERTRNTARKILSLWDYFQHIESTEKVPGHQSNPQEYDDLDIRHSRKTNWLRTAVTT